MAIPKSVANGLISGVVGEISHAGPIRAVSAILSSADEKLNIFGRAYTYKDDSVESVQVGGKGAFAGIMINPKAYRIEEEFARNGTQGEFLTMGEVFVELKEVAGKSTHRWFLMKLTAHYLLKPPLVPVIVSLVLSADTLSQQKVLTWALFV